MTERNNPPWSLIWLVWSGFMLSIGLYVGIFFYFGPQLRIESSVPLIPLRTGFYILVILLFPLIRGLKNRVMGLRSARAIKRQVPPPQSPPFNRYLAATVVALAFAEFIALPGLILFILGDDSRTFFIFLILSSVAMALHRPRESEYLLLKEQFESATPPDSC